MHQHTHTHTSIHTQTDTHTETVKPSMTMRHHSLDLLLPNSSSMSLFIWIPFTTPIVLSNWTPHKTKPSVQFNRHFKKHLSQKTTAHSKSSYILQHISWKHGSLTETQHPKFCGWQDVQHTTAAPTGSSFNAHHTTKTMGSTSVLLFCLTGQQGLKKMLEDLNIGQKDNCRLDQTLHHKNWDKQNWLL